MAEPWWRVGAQDLHRLEDRISSLYAERCHVDRDENAVVLVNKERTVRVPAAYLAVLLLGPGTRITHAATTLLADSGTALCWVGEHGVRLYASGLGPSRGSRLVLRQAYLVTRPTQRLDVARRMYALRFPGEATDKLTMQQLRGREGARVRRLYKHHSQRTGVPWTKREYRPGDAHAAGDDVNRLLSAANSALYGICHAVITGIGASPALGFVHTGSALSFVLDIADLYKADYTIPLAFDLAADGRTEERDARLTLRDAVTQTQLLPRIVSDIGDLLMPDSPDLIDRDTNALWDDGNNTVSGGTNWDDGIFDADNYLAVVGPEFDPPAATGPTP
ncbi:MULTISPECIES: type I-E CRISPR-associated endonuclease Cas1e [unclassified Streptomyces]|uniref:type I-E CRISPR-associated endonuclease Cas1e n=1 Tax=unclassified Streptomyces TaxID=2593676 RepID=UPI002DDC087C|nr:MULTISPECIES: type I-E CRISPR-associated endonuclease Cas1e [unclassified Streptomyces]WSA94708.1 type I-E CRISPR-associated endonuclease Cas1e [Streptomyces sp. NBC_01795]WSB79128.1 type I-E CRISPR-associated endonuclease Cas1e [Streptomyces sp. NBC_01775]WSS12670.1 type I-E CRISPR-associated endonuclease Cas1e [Streptomyces sp. NBC_01186]WSS41454.1 type I-E CRISPR-associated endonuclease Cas1e [Streptomyces sp. NBC_01187]